MNRMQSIFVEHERANGLGVLQRVYLTRGAHLDMAVRLEALRTYFPTINAQMAQTINTISSKLGEDNPLVQACRNLQPRLAELVAWAGSYLDTIRGFSNTTIFSETAPDPAVSPEAWHLAYYVKGADETSLNGGLAELENARVALDLAVDRGIDGVAAAAGKEAPAHPPITPTDWGDNDLSSNVLRAAKKVLPGVGSFLPLILGAVVLVYLLGRKSR